MPIVYYYRLKSKNLSISLLKIPWHLDVINFDHFSVFSFFSLVDNNNIMWQKAKFALRLRNPEDSPQITSTPHQNQLKRDTIHCIKRRRTGREWMQRRRKLQKLLIIVGKTTVKVTKQYQHWTYSIARIREQSMHTWRGILRLGRSSRYWLIKRKNVWSGSL